MTIVLSLAGGLMVGFFMGNVSPGRLVGVMAGMLLYGTACAGWYA